LDKSTGLEIQQEILEIVKILTKIVKSTRNNNMELTAIKQK
jgi:hypothetical protein